MLRYTSHTKTIKGSGDVTLQHELDDHLRLKINWMHIADKPVSRLVTVVLIPLILQT